MQIGKLKKTSTQTQGIASLADSGTRQMFVAILKLAQEYNDGWPARRDGNDKNAKCVCVRST